MIDPQLRKERQRARSRANSKLWRERHPEQAKANNLASRQRNLANAKATRWRGDLARAYGITVADFDLMLEAQGGACACCSSRVPGRSGKFHVDHDHVTGEVRGLLCKRCNLGIGLLGDSIAGVERACRYLMTGRGK